MSEKLKITDIKRYNGFSSGSYVTFSGTLRNQYRFDLLDEVYIQFSGKMVKGMIRGVELPVRDNPDYIYKIQLPKETFGYNDNPITLKCDQIFRNKEEAKASAIKHLEHLHKLNLDNIEKFFNDEKH